MLLSPRDPHGYRSTSTIDSEYRQTGQFYVNQEVQYYSASRKKWFETKVVRINSDMTIDVACRASADVSLVRPIHQSSNGVGPVEMKLQ